MTKTVTPPLTLAQSLRTYAAVAPTVTIEISAGTAREIARALDAQRVADQEVVAIRHCNIDMRSDAREDRLHYWSVIMLCAAAANQLARFIEVLL